MGHAISECCALNLNKSIKNTEIFPIEKKSQCKQCENREFISNYGSHFTSTSNNTKSKSYSSSTSETESKSCPHLSSSNNTSTTNSTLIIPQQMQRAATFQNDNQFHIGDKCQNIGGCKAIKRIIKALKWHSLSFYDGKRAIVAAKIMESQYYKFIMNDYQHILSDHLFEFTLIRQEIREHIEPCNINTCIGFQRFLTLSTKDLSKCDDTAFCIDFMDLIHCYLIHSQHLR